jgi:flavin-dependent dehydrogenase
MNIEYDVVVIGGGPAGSTAGTLLAQQGWRVAILEKERFPRFSIGESLLPGRERPNLAIRWRIWVFRGLVLLQRYFSAIAPRMTLQPGFSDTSP